MSSFLSYLYKRPTAKRYRFAGYIAGHQDAITGVDFSNSGLLLASTGADGVHLFDVRKKTSLSTPTQVHRGAASCVAWLKGANVPKETLCFGTQLGYMIVWRQRHKSDTFQEIFSRRLGTGSEVTCVTGQSSSGERIALGTRDGLVMVWNLDTSNAVENIFSIQHCSSTPISIAIVSEAMNIKVFGLFDGRVDTLDGKDGTVISTTDTLTGIIGYGAASTKKRQYIIDNVNDGFDLYNMENGIFLRNFPTGTPIKRLPKQVGFGEEAKVVVGGTDHGVVYVFDRKRGARLDTLDHGNKHLIQAITTHSADGVHTIASTTSVPGCKNSIYLWTYSSRKRQDDKAGSLQLFFTIVRWCLHFVILVAAVIVIYRHFVAQSDSAPYSFWTDSRMSSFLRGRQRHMGISAADDAKGRTGTKYTDRGNGAEGIAVKSAQKVRARGVILV